MADFPKTDILDLRPRVLPPIDRLEAEERRRDLGDRP